MSTSVGADGRKDLIEIRVYIVPLLGRPGNAEEKIPPDFRVIKVKVPPMLMLDFDQIPEGRTDPGGIRGKQVIPPDRRVPRGDKM